MRQRMSGRQAAIGIVGAVMVMLPLVQVLRYQGAEIEALMAHQEGLDPVVRAVQVQHGLLAHGSISHRVLGGEATLEAQRRERQREVDISVDALGTSLSQGPWVRAGSEAAAMRGDWTLLAQRVTDRRIDTRENEHGHRLLIEQSLQVIDLVTDAVVLLPAATDPAHDGLAATLATLRAVPRLGLTLAALTGRAAEAPAPLPPPTLTLSPTLATLPQKPSLSKLPPPKSPQQATSPPPSQATSVPSPQALAGIEAAEAMASRRSLEALAVAEADLARAQARLGPALAHDAIAAAPLASAAATAGTAAAHYIALLRVPAPLLADVQAARQAALQAQFDWFGAARRAAATKLDKRIVEAEQQRAVLLAALAAMAAVAAVLAAGLNHGVGTSPRSGAASRRRGDTAARPAAEGRHLAGQLLQRLRGRTAADARQTPSAVVDGSPWPPEELDRSAST